MEDFDVLQTIKDLKKSFDLNNIEDYKILLFLIHKYYLSPESIERYELFVLIDEIVAAQNQMKNSTSSKVSLEELYLYFIPQRLRG